MRGCGFCYTVLDRVGRQTERQIDMIIRFIQPQEKNKDPLEVTYDYCRKVLWNPNTAEKAETKGAFIITFLNGKTECVEIGLEQYTEVIYMNDEGKTIDRKPFTPS